MRHGGALAGFACGHLVGHDGFSRVACAFAQADQALTIGEALEQEGDGPNLGLIHQIRGHVAHVDIAGIAGGQVMREADAAHRHLNKDVAHGAGLRDDADVAGDRRHFRVVRHEGEAAAHRVVDDADAVGPDDRHAGGAADRGQSLLLADALFDAGFRIARGEDHHATGADGGGFFHQRFHMLAWHGDHHAVRRVAERS